MGGSFVIRPWKLDMRDDRALFVPSMVYSANFMPVQPLHPTTKQRPLAGTVLIWEEAHLRLSGDTRNKEGVKSIGKSQRSGVSQSPY